MTASPGRSEAESVPAPDTGARPNVLVRMMPNHRQRLVKRSFWHAARRLAAAVVVPLGLVTVMSGCTKGDDTPEPVRSDCHSKEIPDYPELEAVARRVMGDLSTKANTTRFGTCEDTGVPGAIVTVEVKEWTKNIQARRYFKRAGLTINPDGPAFTPDGKWEVSWAQAVIDADAPPFVQVRFMSHY